MGSVLHIGNVAGVPLAISQAQRELGIKSDVLSFDSNPFEYKADLLFSTQLPKYVDYFGHIGTCLKLSERAMIILSIQAKYDVLHFHGSTVQPFGIDIPFWRLLKKKVIIHHHGSELRSKGEKKLYSYFADNILISTPDLFKWSPYAVWIPNPISLERLPFVGVEKKDSSEPLNIVHAPSNRIRKGTKFIVNTINQLKNEGYNINLKIIENVPNSKAILEYKNADIVVDQLLIGWYGVFALECMALGKPVCVHISDDLETYLNYNPVVNVSTKNLSYRLRMLIEDESLRINYGKIGRKFVEHVHNPHTIASKLMDLYDIKE
jgi:glycosyltransferase involved in cell wall biosynthesis